uniref:DUF4806 domain-containing protein n=1 Tax=Daphnia galeata TaxID=27404 RepID=A0A8J2S012_9CRUS|nr:unnamed protein product [Daphnia galeata]
MFLIVEYIIGEDETEVEVVSSSWYSSGRCWWPPGAFARSTFEKKVSKSVDCDKTTWDCYDGRLIASFKTYTEAKAKLPLAIAGELVTPSSTDIDGHKKGKGKRAKQRTRRYLEETSESSDNDIRKNKDNSLKKQKKHPETPSQQGPGSVNHSDTHITLPPVPNALNISSLFSSQSSNEDSHNRTRMESTEHERSNLFDGGNGVSDDSMSSLVIHPRQQLAVARKSTPLPSTPTSPEMDSKKIGVILQRVESLARGIEVVKANQREVLELLTLLLKNSAPPQPDLPSITELFQLPMKTLNDAKNVAKLLRVQNNAAKMRTFVIGIGGTTNSIVGRVMRSIMTYECGSCFCYLGLNEDKVAFKSTTICEIVIEGVREVQNALTKDAVEKKIKNWLRHCPRYKNDEYGRRNGEDEDQQEDAD